MPGCHAPPRIAEMVQADALPKPMARAYSEYLGAPNANYRRLHLAWREQMARIFEEKHGVKLTRHEAHAAAREAIRSLDGDSGSDDDPAAAAAAVPDPPPAGQRAAAGSATRRTAGTVDTAAAGRRPRVLSGPAASASSNGGRGRPPTPSRSGANRSGGNNLSRSRSRSRSQSASRTRRSQP